MYTKSFFISLLLFISLVVFAQNPIIRDQYTAAPSARVFNDKVYLYPAHDIIPPSGQKRKDWFCNEDYHVFSSDNLTEWVDHGVILSQNDIPWTKPNEYMLWASDCIYKNGKYYLYFESANNGVGGNVGVATADRPEGPFTPEPESIKGVGIDPCVLIASDGNAYLYWGNGRCAKLKPNMKELSDDTPFTKKQFGNQVFVEYGVDCLKGLPGRNHYSPYAFEYNGNYYLSYIYYIDKDVVFGYAMSKNPMGPYVYKGLIMSEQTGCETNRHSIINYRGQWYLFYNSNDLSPDNDKLRSVCIEKLFFNPDGTIKEVKPTKRGVGVNKATEKIEIDRFSNASYDVYNKLIDPDESFSGLKATLPRESSWLQYNDVDFSNFNSGYLTVRAKAKTNASFVLHDKSSNGKVIAKVDLTGCQQASTDEEFENDEWTIVNVPLQYIPKGITNLVVTSEGKNIDLDWVQFNKGKMPAKDVAVDNKNPSMGNSNDNFETATSVTTEKPKNTFALIIANEDYQNETKVDFAKNDGTAFKDCCTKTLGLPEKNVHYVSNATLNNIIGELDWLEKICEAFNGDANVIFYYAGHGIPDEASGATYILPSDGNSRILRTCFSIEELYATLGKLPAKKVTVMMDACFSGAVRSGGMLASARGVAIKAKSNNPLGNMIVLSAAQGNETAYKYEVNKHGLFTYYLLKKLNESNGNVTLGELSDYVIKQVKRESIVVNGKIQTPSVLISEKLKQTWEKFKLY